MGKKKKPKEWKVPESRPEPSDGHNWGELMNQVLLEFGRKFVGVVAKHEYVVGEPAIIAKPENCVAIAEYLSGNELNQFKFCRCVTGVDKIDRFDVVYSLASLPKPGDSPEHGYRKISLVVQVADRENPVMPSLCKIWPGVEFQEREVYDMIGVVFENHPDLRRILLDEEFIGFPLRKEYPLYGKWEDMQAIRAYLDEQQIKMMKEDAELEFNSDDVPPNFRR